MKVEAKVKTPFEEESVLMNFWLCFFWPEGAVMKHHMNTRLPPQMVFSYYIFSIIHFNVKVFAWWQNLPTVCCNDKKAFNTNSHQLKTKHILSVQVLATEFRPWYSWVESEVRVPDIHVEVLSYSNILNRCSEQWVVLLWRKYSWWLGYDVRTPWRKHFEIGIWLRLNAVKS